MEASRWWAGEDGHQRTLGCRVAVSGEGREKSGRGRGGYGDEWVHGRELARQRGRRDGEKPVDCRVGEPDAWCQVAAQLGW